ncbi:MAG: Asp-tRNA(Asn)/Glu-tRNA(Gln) amidotransferase subunit GatB, partial [bacterium]
MITAPSGKIYKPTIGLEIHAELKTASKMFCACKNNPDEEKPNVNVCPICMGHPGTLPVINKKAVEHIIRVGHAIGAKIADFTEWDRKNYFYPDIPKGYQISQFAYPLITGGKIGGVELTRIHLEEDTASSQHDKGDFSLVDFNRSSLPLMELVT